MSEHESMTGQTVTGLRTKQIIIGLRSIATEIEMFTEIDPEATVVAISVATLKDWIGDIRVCADDLEDD